MYATTTMPYRRPRAARRHGWWLPLLFALASLSAVASSALFGVQPVFPEWSGSLASQLKAARPLSARLAALAQAGAMAANRSATMRALSLPEDGPGSLLTDTTGDPLVYIQLARIDRRA